MIAAVVAAAVAVVVASVNIFFSFEK